MKERPQPPSARPEPKIAQTPLLRKILTLEFLMLTQNARYNPRAFG
jgi:hypothetical protein